MKRFEYVWSLLLALMILCGSVVWTAASAPVEYPALIGASAQPPKVVMWQRAGCREYSQYEFKVGLVLKPGCQPQAN